MTMPTRGIIRATSNSLPARMEKTQKLEKRLEMNSSSVDVSQHEVEAAHDGDYVGDQHPFEDQGRMEMLEKLAERILSRYGP